MVFYIDSLSYSEALLAIIQELPSEIIEASERVWRFNDDRVRLDDVL